MHNLSLCGETYKYHHRLGLIYNMHGVLYIGKYKLCPYSILLQHASNNIFPKSSDMLNQNNYDYFLKNSAYNVAPAEVLACII